ncbi:MAG TPA: hypothetical protein VK854_08455 [Woeseiaceae bacterium]|nr:hypothetical protein [Woeseiaceae bacterium]
MQRRRTLNRHRRGNAAARCLLMAVTGLYFASPVSGAPGDFPHWNEQGCSRCHGEGPPTIILDYDDDAMCGTCHEKPDTTSCRHPSNVAVGNSGSVSVPEDFRSSIRGGRIVCTTCHDPLVQCLGDKLAPYLNPRFLRGGPFRQPDQACLRCHDSAYYAKLNPHVRPTGAQTEQDVCRFCHEFSGGRISATSWFRIDVSMQCLGCHAVSPHPMSMIPGSGIDSWNHLVVPGESTMRQMGVTRERTGARLPVEPGTGKITCATCHDPHAKGVVVGDPPYLDRARLRPNARCEDCHEK